MFEYINKDHNTLSCEYDIVEKERVNEVYKKWTKWVIKQMFNDHKKAKKDEKWFS